MSAERRGFDFTSFDTAWIGAIAFRGGEYHGGQTVGYYVAANVGDSPGDWACGVANVKNTECLFAYAMNHAEAAFSQKYRDVASKTVYLRKDGVGRMLSMLPVWRARGGLTKLGKVPEAYEEWNSCEKFIVDHKIDISEPHGGHDISSILNKLEDMCKSIQDSKRYESYVSRPLGLIVRREGVQHLLSEHATPLGGRGLT